MSGLRRAVAVAAIGAGTVLGAGGAFALWSASAASGSLGALHPAPLRVIAEDGPPDLYPGFDGGDVTFRVENPNPFPMVVETMTPAEVTSDNPSDCPPSVITVRPAAGLALFVAARSTTGPLSIADVVSMARAAPDGCQGAGFRIALTVTGRQA
jgi:hypothetical protein